MTDTFKSDDADLRIALEKLCNKLIEKQALRPEDKERAIENIMDALNTAHGKGNVPKDIFTDPAKQQNLIVGLITSPIMEKVPALKFDLVLFFKANLQPEETKKLFKAFWMGMNKLEPDPNKRRSEEAIDAEADALLASLDQLKKDKSLKPSEANSDRDELEETFETLFGMTRFGMPIALSVNKGNVAGYVDTYSAGSLGGGSIHEGRGFSGDGTTDPYVTAMAKERLADLAGIGGDVLKDLIASKIIHQSPTFKPSSGG